MPRVAVRVEFLGQGAPFAVRPGTWWSTPRPPAGRLTDPGEFVFSTADGAPALAEVEKVRVVFDDGTTEQGDGFATAVRPTPGGGAAVAVQRSGVWTHGA